MASPTYVAAGGEFQTSASSVTKSWTPTAGSNRKLLFFVSWQGGATMSATGLTVNGVTTGVTNISGTVGASGQVRGRTFYLDEANIPAGPWNAVATISSNNTGLTLLIIELADAKQGAPNAEGSTAHTTGTALETSITPTVNECLIACRVASNTGTHTPYSGQTTRTGHTSSSPRSNASTEVQATAATEAFGVTNSLSVSSAIATAIAIEAAVASPTISLDDNDKTFSAPAGGGNPATQTVNITNVGGGTLNDLVIGTVSYGSGSGWVTTASLDQATAPAVLTIGVTTGALSAGQYTATVPVQSATSTNSPQNVSVTFNVTATPTQLAIITQPAGHVVGQVGTQAAVVELRDASNNPVLQSGTDIAVAIKTGLGILSGTTPRATNASGRATFSGISLNAITTFTVEYTSSGLTPVTSSNIVVSSLIPTVIRRTGGRGMQRVESGAVSYVYFMARDATDFVTPLLGLSSFTVTASQGSNAPVVFTTPTVIEVDDAGLPGQYRLALDEQNVISAGLLHEPLVLTITHAGMDTVIRDLELFELPGVVLRGTAIGGSDANFTAQAGQTPEIGQTVEFYAGPWLGARTIIDVQDSGGNKVGTFDRTTSAAITSSSLYRLYGNSLPATAGEVSTTTTAAVFARGFDPTKMAGLSFEQAFGLMVSVLLGRASGLATGTAVFRNPGNTADAVSAGIDPDGNRASVTLNTGAVV